MKIKKGRKYGPLNGHAIGIIMKEMVRRAIVAIRNQRMVFQVKVKQGYSGEMDDVLTTADTEAQKIYLRTIQECFPDWGVVAEEDYLFIDCKNGFGYYFTLDPLDGTKAFTREQSHGVGTMISLCHGDEFVAAYVGDVNTQEIFGFRPGSDSVHRINEFNVSRLMSFKPQALFERYVILRDPSPDYSKASQKLIARFKSELVDGGSIGLWLARLWKGEVGAAMITPSFETPWDANPVVAISLKLGFVFLRFDAKKGKWVQFDPKAIKKTFKRDFDILIVHESDLEEVLKHK